MKIRSLLLCVVFVSVSRAPASAEIRAEKSMTPIPANMKFLTPVSSETEHLRFHFNTLAEMANLPIVSAPKSIGYPVSFDLMAIDKKFEHAILLGAKQKVSAEYLDHLYKSGDAIFVPMTVASQSVSVIFVGFDEAEVRTLLQKFKNEYALVKSGRSRFPASEVAVSNRRDAAESSYTTGEFAYALGDSFAKCGLGLVEGVNQIVIEPFVMAGRSAKNLLTQPAHWIRGSVEQLKGIKENLLHFDRFARKQWRDFDRKSPQEKSRIYCSFAAGNRGIKAIARGIESIPMAASSRLTSKAQTPASVVNAPSTLNKVEIPEFRGQSGFTNDAIRFGVAHQQDPFVREAVKARWEAVDTRTKPYLQKYRDRTITPEEKAEARALGWETQYYREMLQAIDGQLPAN